MFKLFLSLLLFAVIACNSDPKTPSATAPSAIDTSKSFAWPDEDEKEFLADCVANAEARLNDTAAFAYCKCVLEQLKHVYPNLDSAAAIIIDSARAAAYVEKCK